MSKRTNPPGRVVIVHGGDGDVDDAAGAIKRFLKREIPEVLVHTCFEMLSVEINDFVIK